ncbi:MAG: hypothetical protein C0608_00185 [Deltaproteobacteria bacterium]|nr:MAG: hypothetical protein C0608_00185 [Deltaproteobacteria bacterium]
MDINALNPLFTIALIFASGYAGGLLAKRLHMPSVTGNIIVGVALGPSIFGFFSEGTAQLLEPATMFAMGLITAVIGGHLSWRRLHNSVRRILSVTLVEVIFTYSLVVFAIYFLTEDMAMSLILGAIATATAPATVLAVFREERAKGLMVKTTLASVALDNVLCLILFSATMVTAAQFVGPGAGSLGTKLALAGRDLLFSVMIGAVAGKLILTAVRRRDITPFTGLLFGVLMTTGGAQSIGLNPLLTNLSMGVVLGNSGREGEDLVSALEDFQPMVLTSFFTLAGIDLHLSSLPAMGVAGGAYLVTRGIGKVFGASIGAYIGGAPPRVSKAIGPTLLPQAGLAIGLLVVLQGDGRFPSELVGAITNVVLATVVLNEIFGPPLVRRSVRAAEEAGKDRRRLVEFLQEEHILYPLKAEDKWDAIRKMGEFMIKTHGVSDVTLDDLVESVEARERSFSTAIGSGVALPHAHIESGPEILGAMGLCPKGVDFDAPDGEPVRVVILIATPEGYEERHLEIMSAVAGLMSDPEVRAHLLTARSSAEIYEILESGARQDYNYFLDD